MGRRHLPAKSKTPRRVKFPSSWAKRVMATPRFLNASLGSLLLLTSCIFLSSQIRLQLFLCLCAASYHLPLLDISEATRQKHSDPPRAGGSCHVGRTTASHTQLRGANTFATKKWKRTWQSFSKYYMCICCMPGFWAKRKISMQAIFSKTTTP